MRHLCPSEALTLAEAALERAAFELAEAHAALDCVLWGPGLAAMPRRVDRLRGDVARAAARVAAYARQP